MKKQTIGFDRELQLDWLDKTAGLVREDYDLSAIRQQLHMSLATDVPGQEARRKTITLLTRLWMRIPAEHQQLRQDALHLLINLPPTERLWLHWGMSMIAYPFFFDVARTVGHLLSLQGNFEALQVRRRMRESWGQRTTLDRAIGRVIQTFTLWEVIKQTSTYPQIYSSNKTSNTTNPKLAAWLLTCTLYCYRQSVSLNGIDSVPLETLLNAPAIFPFEVTKHTVTLRESPQFEMSYQGLNIEYVTLSESQQI